MNISIHIYEWEQSTRMGMGMVRSSMRLSIYLSCCLFVTGVAVEHEKKGTKPASWNSYDCAVLWLPYLYLYIRLTKNKLELKHNAKVDTYQAIKLKQKKTSLVVIAVVMLLIRWVT